MRIPSLPHHAPKLHLSGPCQSEVPAGYAVVFVELRKATRRDIRRDVNWAKTAQLPSRLISTAKPALLHSGFFRRAAWRNAGAVSYAIVLGAKYAPITIASLPDPLSARHCALGIKKTAIAGGKVWGNFFRSVS